MKVRSRGSKKKVIPKTSCLGGRMSDYRNHSKNSLRSDSFSCRLACLANAIQESKKIPIIVYPINTSSCGMFFGITFFFSSYFAFHWDKSLELRSVMIPHCVRSKTFRTRRSLEECKFFESLLSLGLRRRNLSNEIRKAV